MILQNKNPAATRVALCYIDHGWNKIMHFISFKSIPTRWLVANHQCTKPFFFSKPRFNAPCILNVYLAPITLVLQCINPTPRPIFVAPVLMHPNTQRHTYTWVKRYKYKYMHIYLFESHRLMHVAFSGMKTPIGCAAKYKNTMYRAAVIYRQIVQESFYQRKYIHAVIIIHIVLGQDDTLHRWSLMCIFDTYLIRNRSSVCMFRSMDPFPSQWH